MAKKGYIQKRHRTYWLHDLISCIHDDEDFTMTLDQILKRKQNILVNQKNIRSINGVSLLGSGNITIGTGGDIFVDGGDPIDDPTVSYPDDISGGSVTSGFSVVRQDQYDSLVGEGNLKNILYAIYDPSEDKIVKLYAKDKPIEIGGLSSVIVDDALDKSSTNPVQNKIIFEELSKKQDVIFSVVDGKVCLTYNA